MTVNFLRLLSAVFALSLCANSFAFEYESLPTDLLTKAITAESVYDEDFDYAELGTANNLLHNPAFADHLHVAKQLVDAVVVNKAAHQMILLKDGKEIRKFWIALSDRPYGAKQYEGDKRTPEGTYTLDYVKKRSNYYKAMHISYPNAKDIANARSMGKRPGGMIMVHGQPPSRSEYQETVQRTDWTNGCIALLNPDLDIFLSLVDVGTPITINP